MVCPQQVLFRDDHPNTILTVELQVSVSVPVDATLSSPVTSVQAF